MGDQVIPDVSHSLESNVSFGSFKHSSGLLHPFLRHRRRRRIPRNVKFVIHQKTRRIYCCVMVVTKDITRTACPTLFLKSLKETGSAPIVNVSAFRRSKGRIQWLPCALSAVDVNRNSVIYLLISRQRKLVDQESLKTVRRWRIWAPVSTSPPSLRSVLLTSQKDAIGVRVYCVTSLNTSQSELRENSKRGVAIGDCGRDDVSTWRNPLVNHKFRDEMSLHHL